MVAPEFRTDVQVHDGVIFMRLRDLRCLRGIAAPVA